MSDWLLLIGWLMMAVAWIYVGGWLSKRINERLSPDHPDPDVPHIARPTPPESGGDDD